MEVADDVETGPAIHPEAYKPKTIDSELGRPGLSDMVAPWRFLDWSP